MQMVTSIPMTILFVLLLTSLGVADDNLKKEEKLPGSNLAADEAGKRASWIVRATFTDIGVSDPNTAGVASFSGANINIEEVLKGEKSTAEFSVTYTVVSYKVNEQVPALKTAYIFFLKKVAPKRYECIKLLAANDANISEIKKILNGSDGK